jgi:hypothetical protein
MILPRITPPSKAARKSTLVDLGAWAVLTGRGWLVHLVHRTLEQEELRHA